jgi:hypothetical protein
MRVLIAYAEACGYGVELSAFRNVGEAQRWLAADPAAEVPGQAEASL